MPARSSLGRRDSPDEVPVDRVPTSASTSLNLDNDAQAIVDGVNLLGHTFLAPFAEQHRRRTFAACVFPASTW
jgi:hypothetical protein